MLLFPKLHCLQGAGPASDNPSSGWGTPGVRENLWRSTGFARINSAAARPRWLAYFAAPFRWLWLWFYYLPRYIQVGLIVVFLAVGGVGAYFLRLYSGEP